MGRPTAKSLDYSVRKTDSNNLSMFPVDLKKTKAKLFSLVNQQFFAVVQYRPEMFHIPMRKHYQTKESKTIP